MLLILYHYTFKTHDSCIADKMQLANSLCMDDNMHHEIDVYVKLSTRCNLDITIVFFVYDKYALIYLCTLQVRYYG